MVMFSAHIIFKGVINEMVVFSTHIILREVTIVKFTTVIFFRGVRMMKFAHNSCSLLSCCSEDFTISLCNLDPYSVKTILEGHTGTVRLVLACVNLFKKGGGFKG